MARSFRRLSRVLVPALALALATPAFAASTERGLTVQVVVDDPTKNPIPAAADAGAPVPTDQAKGGCKSCMMQSSSSRSSVPLSVSALVLAMFALRRRRAS